ncbi:hypothetical protein HDV00_009560 [Rhizophlyctis rosea]|nr:hypothetical protein HDV00_009560 [Rhizophlyctis rosea]
MYGPDGTPLLVQGPGYKASDPDPEVYTSETTLGTPGYSGATKLMKIVNMCPHKIWPAIQGKKDAPVPADGGFGMAPGVTVNVNVPWDWESGRIWARTNCKTNNGKVFCETGTCGIPENNYGIQCQGNGGIPPYTIAEFTLHGWGPKDYYDISQVDGHNIGIAVTVLKGTKINDPEKAPPAYDCGNPSCRFDIDKMCPPELTFKSDDQKRVIACGSIHNAVEDLVHRTFNPDPLVKWFNDDNMRHLLGCVAPDYGYSKLDVRPEAVGNVCDNAEWPSVQEGGNWPNRYDEVFKKRCPDAYSWQFDDMSSTYFCLDADYQITFCPPAECGKDAGGKTCDNNYCCSSFGACGLGKGYCDAGCQSNCNSLDDFPPPDHCNNGALTKVVAYYSNSAADRGNGLPNCNGVLPALAPEDIKTTGITHLVYAFGIITPQFTLGTSRSSDASLIPRFNGLKKSNPSLKTLWAIGGWNFNSDSSTASRFSDAVTDSGNRATLVADVIKSVVKWGFDGVDFDWEWPGVERGGRDSDPQNYVQFIKELRAAANKANVQLLIAITVPARMDKLGSYNLEQLQKDVDWINLMTYDFNGSGSGGGAGNAADVATALAGGYNSPSPSTWPQSAGVQPHTSILDVDDAVKGFLKAGVRREKLVMGIAFYGRNYQLSKPDSCNKMGCPFSGPGAPGVCTNTAGFLSYNEIQDMISKNHATPSKDDNTDTAYVSIGSNWISYETPDTLQRKMILANNQCLIGVSVWSSDLDPAGLLLLSIYGHANTIGNSRTTCAGDGRFPTTKANAVASLDCPYGGGKISRPCNSGGSWGDIRNECDDVDTKFLSDDFKNCKNGVSIDTSMNSLGLTDVSHTGGSSNTRKRKREEMPIRPAHARPRSFIPDDVEEIEIEGLVKRQASTTTSRASTTASASSTTTAAAYASVTDLWDLLKSVSTGDLPSVKGVIVFNHVKLYHRLTNCQLFPYLHISRTSEHHHIPKTRINLRSTSHDHHFPSTSILQCCCHHFFSQTGFYHHLLPKTGFNHHLLP